MDIPHFYLGEWGDTPLYLKKKYKDYDTFRKSWTVKVSNGKELRIWNRTKTRAIRKVPNGKKVEVMFVKGKYAKVRYRGTVGYMKSVYLK